MRIAQIASEAAPFAKTGGLGDVSSALTGALARAGHDARLFLPLYKSLKPSGRTFTPVSFLTDVPLAMGGRALRFTVFTAPLPGGGPPIYFVGCPALYDRAGIYAQDGDEHVRYGFLTRAALESLQRMGFAPDVVHAHDWHAALAPLYLKTLYAWDRGLFGRTKTVLTIHNLAYQGGFPRSALADLDLEPFAGMLHQDHLRQGAFSFLVTGLLHADAVTAVSETYAREIQTPAHGFGLDGLLRARARSVFGIVNGIDAGEWDPAMDPHIAAGYSVADLGGKTLCRAAILAETGLGGTPAGHPAPVVGIVSRLTAQKGFDLALEVLPAFLAAGRLRLVALGTGSEAIAQGFRDLARRFPRAVSFDMGFSNEKAHRIEAGADFFLMPSRFEPCGLNQMYSQRYGTPPIVHLTGGLADTVEPWNPLTGSGTGFGFEHFTSSGLRWALEQALHCFADAAAFRRVQLAGMLRDFSWERQVGTYERLYERLVRSGS
jgi:starch synthase